MDVLDTKHGIELQFYDLKPTKTKKYLAIPMMDAIKINNRQISGRLKTDVFSNDKVFGYMQEDIDTPRNLARFCQPSKIHPTQFCPNIPSDKIYFDYSKITDMAERHQIDCLYIPSILHLGENSRIALINLYILLKLGVIVKSLNRNDNLILNSDKMFQPVLIAAAVAGTDYEQKKSRGKSPLNYDWDKLERMKKDTGWSELKCVHSLGWPTTEFYKAKTQKKSKKS